jgi:hypothetical protein
MYFKGAKPTSNLRFRFTYKTLEVGIYPVLYGFRVRAGTIGEPICHVDWCCGDSHATVQVYLQLLIEILEARIAQEIPLSHLFEGIPIASRVKPLVNDVEFLTNILEFDRREMDAILIPPGTWQDITAM